MVDETNKPQPVGPFSTLGTDPAALADAAAAAQASADANVPPPPAPPTDAQMQPAAAPAPLPDTGGADYDLYHVTGNRQVGVDKWEGDTVRSITRAWLDANPQSKHSFNYVYNYIVDVNHLKDRYGRLCTGKKELTPFVYDGTTIKVPEGNEIPDKAWIKACPQCNIPPKKAEVAPPPVAAEPPPPPPPVEKTVVIAPRYEFFGMDAPSQDPKVWRTGTQMHAFELLARTGLNEQYSHEHYSVKNVVSRHSGVDQDDTGELYDSVDGNDVGDFKKEGAYFHGEDNQSKRDNKIAARDDRTSGKAGYLGKVGTGPRGRTFETGDIMQITDDGALVRSDKSKWIIAHGGNYAANFPFGVQVRFGNMGGLPVAIARDKPNNETVLNSSLQRWGISQPNAAQAAVNEAGFNNLFRDQQTTLTGPMETPDRIYAYTFGLNAKKEFVVGMDAFDNAATPEEKKAAAVHALTAYRDLEDNLMVKRVDSYRIPMQNDLNAVRNYIASQGVDLSAVDAEVAQAPRLLPKDMPLDELKTMPGYKTEKDTHYGTFAPDQTNAAYAAAVAMAYPTMNRFEAYVARGGENARTVPEQELNLSLREQAVALMNAQGANKAVADTMMDSAHSTLGINVVNTLRDMELNWKRYHFETQDQAIAYAHSFIGDDKTALKQVDKKGNTTMIPLIGKDDRFGGDNPDAVVPLIAQHFADNPASFNDYMERISNPDDAKDSKGRTTGQPALTGFFRAFAAERPQAGAADGATPAGYQRLTAALGISEGNVNEQPLLRAVTKAAIAGENGRRGNSLGAQIDLDNRTATAQEVRAGAQVVTTEEQLDAVRKGDGTPGTVDVVRGDARDEKIADAVQNDDMGALYRQVVTSDGARETGAHRAALNGLTRQPALARDAVVLTVLRDPKAFNKVIEGLERLDDSVRGDRYGEMAGALRSARHAALDYQKHGRPEDMDRAVRAIGGFFANMETQGNKNVGAQRLNAWNAMVDLVSNDERAGNAMLDAIGADPQMQAAVIKAVPELVAADDGQRRAHEGKLGKGNQMPTNINGNDVYDARFFTLSRDKHGKVEGTGFLNGNIDRIAVDHDALAALVPTHVATQAGVIGGSLNQSGVNDTSKQAAMDDALGTSPEIYTGKAGDPVALTATWLKQHSSKLPDGVSSYEQLAQTLLDSNVVKVQTNADQMMLAVETDTENMKNSLAKAAQLAGAPGIAAWWLLLGIKPHHGKNPPTQHGDVPECCPDPRPPAPTPPIPSAPTDPLARG